MDLPRRTLVKMVLWNLMGLTTMCLVGFVMTGSAAVGGTIAVVNTVIGMACYFVYEQVWARIRWGRTHD